MNTLPTTPLYDEAYQSRVASAIHDSSPPFAKSYGAVFYGAGATSPSIIQVPVFLGLLDATTPDHLDLTWWIPLGGCPNASSFDVAQTRLKVTHWPFEFPKPLTHGYTVCWTPQPYPDEKQSHAHPDWYRTFSTRHPVNALFERESAGGVPFHGNVVVVKHAGHSSEGLIDAELGDIGITSAIVSRAIEERLFFSNLECCTLVFEQSRFKEFAAVSHVSRFLRSCANQVFFRRVVSRVGVNLSDEYTPYRETVRRTRKLLELMVGDIACIVGSTVQGLVCLTAANEGLHVSPVPDLNILVTEDALQTVLRLLTQDLGMTCDLLLTDHSRRMEYDGLVSTNRHVTITCCVGRSVLRVLLASRTTSQMNALTRAYLISFYPHMTRRRMGLLAWPAVVAEIASYTHWNTAPLNDYTKLRRRTSGFKRECGWVCPRMWRMVQGFKGVGVYAWGIEEPVPFENQRVVWRIGEECGNDNCPNRGKTSLPLPSSFVRDGNFLDLILYAHVSRKARLVVQAILGLRCVEMLRNFFDVDALPLFWTALNIGRGGLTGSAPVWISQPRPEWTLDNVNAVVVAGGSEALRNFLSSDGWAAEAIESRVSPVISVQDGRALEPYADGATCPDITWRYTKPGRPCITVTETGWCSVFLHLVGARHTMATMLLTSTTIIAIHPSHCIASSAEWRAGRSDYMTPELEDIVARVQEMGGTFASINPQTRCGSGCLGLMRRMRGGRKTGLLRWGGHGAYGHADTVAADAYNGFDDEHYGFGWTWATCTNISCDTFRFPRTTLRQIAARSLPNPKLAAIDAYASAIFQSLPAFPLIHKGVLFATSCAEPLLVPVPLDHGVNNYRTMDDLRTYGWIRPRIPGAPTIPHFMPPHTVVGASTLLNAFGWRVAYGSNRHLLIFMATSHLLGPTNPALSLNRTEHGRVHGDLLLMIEEDGGIVDVEDCMVANMQQAFDDVWASQAFHDARAQRLVFILEVFTGDGVPDDE
ncbi:hypothetical protein C8F04DRAFT_1274274 [Mycena alexandri]|uniref:Uncharacterized protein n=1 Tax=Mycena alexandri TaxID=1745969 RepID=A0AAD6S882_9AGAR|nr:hypothetical protein C8F04DRAFT_1274274 [Mycena alexandri]